MLPNVHNNTKDEAAAVVEAQHKEDHNKERATQTWHAHKCVEYIQATLHIA